MDPILSLKKIGFRYGPSWALKKINLQVETGEIIGILGPNGSGKSTLLRIIDGILKPQEGQIFLKGAPLGNLGRADIAREIAMVAQESHFRFAFTTLEVVLMGRFPHLRRMQFESSKDIDAAQEALRVTQTMELADRSIHELSGGEKQRVLIARALAQEPKIILLDEPTSFLDLKFKREIFQLISLLSRDRGLTVVLVSHDIDLAAQYCSRLVLLKNGTVFEMGTPEKVISAANIEEVYQCPVLVDRNPESGRPRVSILP